jgi:carbonic anhydrase
VILLGATLVRFCKQRRIATMVCWSAALFLGACSGTGVAPEGHDDTHPVHWGYEADDGPAVWASMDPDWALCGEGREQSPIDLTGAVGFEFDDAEIHIPTVQEVEVLNQGGVIDALDNGHTIQINAKTGETMTVEGRTYALVQFHFHAPSEHTVDGRHLPMEIHFVHQSEDGALAVVGALVEVGEHNPGIAPLWEQLSAATGTQAIVRVPPEFGDQIFPPDTTGVYRYRGSLTTPPCSEDVLWYVRKTPTRLSREQIAAFAAIYDHNNRPVQPLNERTLYVDDSPALTIR